MVRHEAAEAIGAIHNRWDEAKALLKEFLQDEDELVRESCEVALDAGDEWVFNYKSDTAGCDTTTG